ncbi:MAG: peptidyl-prolyl cis-trans isomerase [Blastocatellia bacterium]|nr:peptidyl-prolyl cis-trans isomerase [Blastocatellia bacterium]
MKKSGTKLSMALVLLVLAFSACNEKSSNTTSKNSDANAAKDSSAKTGVKPQPDAQVAVIETADFGRIVIELYPNVAPKMVERFKKLINEHFYDGTAVHRVDASLGIIQGGDPLTKGNNAAVYGTGNSPYANVPAEFSDIPYERGTVGAARTGDINGANCQWFITLKKQPAFDKKYTVFGRVIDGVNNAEVIMHAPTEQGTPRPSDKVVIKSVTLQPRSSFPAGS